MAKKINVPLSKPNAIKLRVSDSPRLNNPAPRQELIKSKMKTKDGVNLLNPGVLDETLKGSFIDMSPVKSQDHYNRLHELRRMYENDPQYRLAKGEETEEEQQLRVNESLYNQPDELSQFSRPRYVNTKMMPARRDSTGQTPTLDEINKTSPELAEKLNRARYNNIIESATLKMSPKQAAKYKEEYERKYPYVPLNNNVPTNEIAKGKPKKFFLGGVDPISLTSTALNTGLQIYTALDDKAKAKNAQAFADNAEKQARRSTDAAYLSDYNQEGNRQVSMYANGGIHKLNARKGLIPMGNDLYYANGNTHKTGGIQVGPDAEIQDKELVQIKDGKLSVLSDNDKKFGVSPARKAISNINAGINPNIAFNSELIAQELVKGNDKKKDSNKFVDGGEDYEPIDWFNLNRFKDLKPLQSKPVTLDNNYTPSEELTISNSPSGNPIVANANVYKELNKKKSQFDFAPFIDNVGNLIATAFTPKTSRPILDRAVQFHTDVNVDPQLQSAIDSSISANKFIKSGFADSNVAAALSQKNANDTTKNISAINANKQNAELQLKNQQVQTNAAIEQSNNAKLSNFLDRDRERSKGMWENVSQNISDIGNDVVDTKNRQKEYDFRNKQLLYEMLKQPNPEVMQNALAYDPETFQQNILPRFEQLTGDSSYLPESTKNIISQTYGDKYDEAIKTAEEKAKRRVNRKGFTVSGYNYIK